METRSTMSKPRKTDSQQEQKLHSKCSRCVLEMSLYFPHHHHGSFVGRFIQEQVATRYLTIVRTMLAACRSMFK